jgi:hypothetical protein
MSRRRYGGRDEEEEEADEGGKMRIRKRKNICGRTRTPRRIMIMIIVK